MQGLVPSAKLKLLSSLSSITEQILSFQEEMLEVSLRDCRNLHFSKVRKGI